jgi:very-short-patch-repair endonuclease
LTEREIINKINGIITGEKEMSKQDKRWHTNTALGDTLKPIAREKRKKPTEAENLLWQHLHDYKVPGYKFRRQHSIGQFIVDFYCTKARLVIEVDGLIHQYQGEEDTIRQEYLESLGLKVIRFSNDAILNDIDDVMKKLTAFLTNPV